MIDQLPSEYIYSEMFKAFDLESQGSIAMDDLYLAAKTMNWNQTKVAELIHDLDPKHEDNVNA